MVSDVHRESALPGDLHKSQDVEYWDSFFKLRNGRPFEWYSDWSDLQSYLSMLLPKSNSNPAAHILVAGCGNSALSAHLYDAAVYYTFFLTEKGGCKTKASTRNSEDMWPKNGIVLEWVTCPAFDFLRTGPSKRTVYF